MIILEILALIVVLIIILAVMLMPYMLIALGIFCLSLPFLLIYYDKLPDIKLCDDKEIPIENVTFTPRNLLEEDK